jgi:hypothetical protein
MIGPLAELFNVTSGVRKKFPQIMPKTDVHVEFLLEIFKGFDLTWASPVQHDAILSQFTRSLSTINIETENMNNTVDQTIRINQVIGTNITGDESEPVWIYQPRTRIIYMQTDANTWRWATRKAEQSQNTFNMRYVVVDCDLKVNKYLASKGKLNNAFYHVTGKSLSEFGKMINPAPIDPNIN